MSPEPASPAGASAPKVFICYRREDTAAHAGRLYDAMVTRFGEGNVFMDVDLDPGVDFVERITEVVSACKVLIVVMGPNWATVTDEEGEVRIADPDDFVRLELETAIARPEVTPIPVLVSGARMPRREDLPPELQPIARRNALELSEPRWGYDVGRLVSTLDGLLTDGGRDRGVVAPDPRPEPEPEPQPPAPAPRPSAARLVLEGMLVAGVTALAARWLANAIHNPHDDPGKIANVILRRGATWAIVGAALATWLGMRTRRTDAIRLGLIGLLVGAIAGAVGGAIWALPVYLSDPNLGHAARDRIDVGSLAVTGALLGALIGALWRPPRLGAGLASGIVAGALIRLVINGIGWDRPTEPETVLAFAVAGAAIAGLTLAILLTLDRQRSRPGRSA